MKREIYVDRIDDAMVLLGFLGLFLTTRKVGKFPRPRPVLSSKGIT